MELLLLKLRNAIVDKEWILASANSDLAKFGEWRCNWAEGISEMDYIIDGLIDEINRKGVEDESLQNMSTEELKKMLEEV